MLCLNMMQEFFSNGKSSDSDLLDMEQKISNEMKHHIRPEYITRIDAPIIIRLDGTNADEGRAILQPALNEKLMMEPTMLDAARKAVELAKGVDE